MPKVKRLSLKQAKTLIYIRGTRLVKMASRENEKGYSYYLIPGGLLDEKTAETLMNMQGVYPQEDGLFPGHSQTWMFRS